jgi:hypothetical protein
MKLSWGYLITFGYLSFVGGMGFLIYKATSQKFDLVTSDYYEEELKYQSIIDQSANTAKLSAPPDISKTATELKIEFPVDMKDKVKAIDFYLYYPADAKRDFKKSMNIQENEFTQPLPAAMKGMYELKLSWQAAGVKYYFEKKLFF